MKSTSTNKTLISQASTILMVATGFFVISKFTSKAESFIAGMIFYWLILLIQITIINKSTGTDNLFIDPLKSSQNKQFSLISFVPPILIFFIVFIPLLGSLKITVLIVTIIIGLINGYLEECYWRGSIYQESGMTLAITSTILFALNHGSFLFFDISYQGGAPSLIGGPLIMGGIWLFVAKKTMTLKHVILSHQIVNSLAFYSMFINL